MTIETTLCKSQPDWESGLLLELPFGERKLMIALAQRAFSHRKPGKTNYRNNVPEWPQWKRTEKDRKSSKGDTGDECTSRKSHADEGLVQTLADGELLVNDNANRCIIRALKEQEKVTRE